MNENIGKKVIDLSELLFLFEEMEGTVEQIIGATGMGKTYEGTRRAYKYLTEGHTVYTSWKLNLPDVFDERKSLYILFWKTVLGKKYFYKFDFKKNWHYIDIENPNLADYIASLTDCIVFLDEGQDTFDSRGRITKKARQSITRSRHLHKTLIIISQRAQAVDVTARANVQYFYKCVKTLAWFWPFIPYFKIYRTEEMDNQNFPIWENLMTGWKAELWRAHFANKNIYNLYNSWYLRAGIPRSQEFHFDAYSLSFFEKIKAIYSLIFGRKKTEKKNIVKYSETGSNTEKVLQLWYMAWANPTKWYKKGQREYRKSPIGRFWLKRKKRKKK